MTRPNLLRGTAKKPLSRDGHRPDCKRPFVHWADVLGNTVGWCESCEALFTRRVDWTEPERSKETR